MQFDFDIPQEPASKLTPDEAAADTEKEMALAKTRAKYAPKELRERKNRHTHVFGGGHLHSKYPIQNVECS